MDATTWPTDAEVDAGLDRLDAEHDAGLHEQYGLNAAGVCARCGRPPAGDVPADPVELDRWIDWRLRRIAQERAQMERNTDIARAEIERYTRWLDEANATHANSIAWLEGQVEQAARGYDFGKKKSRRLPHGTFGYRQAGGRATIMDMAAAVAFARQHDVPVKESVSTAELKAFIESTGAELPFVEIEPKQDHFYVKVSE
jgi:hypothetical protein